MTVNSARRNRPAIALPAMAALVVFLLCTGCGTSPGAGITASSESTTSSLSSSTSSDSVTSAQPEDVDELFAELAGACQPLDIFAPTVLPEKALLADHWFPVLESEDPGSYEGPAADNPQVLGSGADSEIQVIFQVGDGWLAVLENFRGDLGDVTGTPVGSVAGNAAALYEVNGGKLVQWSQNGLWYGVFGRGLSEGEVTRTALGMQPVSAE